MKHRPQNLNFLTMRFPITAWVSILHRISGLFVFLMIPLLLWALQESLSSEESFLQLKNSFKNSFIQFSLWVFLSGLLYHFVAGLRHLLLDIHIGESKKASRLTAKLVLLISAVLIAMLGLWLKG